MFKKFLHFSQCKVHWLKCKNFLNILYPSATGFYLIFEFTIFLLWSRDYKAALCSLLLSVTRSPPTLPNINSQTSKNNKVGTADRFVGLQRNFCTVSSLLQGQHQYHNFHYFRLLPWQYNQAQ